MKKSDDEKTYSYLNNLGSSYFKQIRFIVISIVVKFSFFIVFFCTFFYQANAQPGSADITFGNNGEVFILMGDNSIYYMQVKACSILPDGKILVAGYYQVTGVEYYCKQFILKFNQDGSIDNSFGYAGKMEMWVSGYILSQLQDMVVQPDGKILLAVNLHPSEQGHACIIRLYSNGVIDESFGNNGYLYSGSHTSFSRIAFQSDGKILVCGTDYSNQGIARHALYRYNTDWSIDVSFGNNGNFYGWHGRPNSVKIQSNGKILIGGYVMSGVKSIPRITRANGNGEKDLEFGTYGFFDLPEVLDCTVNEVALQTDNKILVSMSAYTSNNSRSIITRLNTNGTIDTSFGDEGSVITCSDLCNGNGLNILPDGKIVLLEGIGICRMNNDGTIDNSFGQTGHYIFGEGYGYPKICNVMNIQSDSKIISAGVHYDQLNDLHRIYITRLNNGTVGVNSDDNISKFEFFPIPFTDKLYLKNLTNNNAVSQISIYNFQGQVILNIYPIAHHVDEVDLNQVNPGQYLVNIQFENGVVLSKVIIKN